MKRFTKRCLAIVLTFAMSITLLPSSAGMVYAEEMATEEGTQAMDVQADTGVIDNQADTAQPEAVDADGLAVLQDTALEPRAAYTFEEADLTDKTITDTSGNGYDATLKGEGATIADGMLMLPGGAAGSTAAYVELPGTIFEGQDTLTINVWLKNQTGAGNYAGMYFGTKTKHVDSSSSADMPLNYWLLNPMETDSKKNLFKSVWTNDNNTGAPYSTEVGPGKGDAESVATDDQWRMYTTVITENSIATYYDGKKVNSVSKTKKTTDFGTGLVAYIGRSSYNDKFYKGGVHSVSVYNAELKDADIAQLYQDTKLNIPLRGVNIAGENTVMAGGTLQLSATLVPDYATVEDKTVTWESDNTSVATIDNKGKVTAVAEGDAIITAKVGDVTSEPFTIHVVNYVDSLSPGYYLTVYSTTKDFYTDGSMREQETRSVYMAVSDDGKTFNVLNNGGGVIFSKNTNGTLQVTKPRVYIDNTKDVPFTVVASDSDASKGMHVFTSTDGVHYYDDTLVTSTELYSSPLKKDSFQLMFNGSNILTTDSSITLGNAVELTDDQYTYIVDKLGTVTNTGLESLKSLKITGEQGSQITTGTLNEMYPSINATYTDGSIQNFKIDWTESLTDKDLTKPGTYTLAGKVIQPQYINNLKELNGSTLRDDDPANANPDFPDNYDSVTGTVYYDKTKFIEGMADPNIYWDEQSGYYYMTASYFPEDGDKIDSSDNTQQYDRVVLRRGRTLEELQTRKGNQVTIWKVGNQGFDDNGTQKSSGYRYIWAPELHRVGDKWVVYFTESHASDNAFNIYSHALVLDGDKDPYETALKKSNEVSQWKDYKMRKDESLAVDIKDPFEPSFCLDMTYFKDEVSGQSYVLWAGKPTASYEGTSTDVFIATVDEYEPWKITSAATRLTCSEYGWERIRYRVNEGPTVLQHDGNVFMCYSVSGTGSEYAIGMCSAKNGADLLDINNWTKSPYPLLTSRDVNGEEGPGHNSFTVDKDGNNIFVYHARPTSHNYQKCGKYNSEPLNDPCRHARLKRVHWAADGTPILKMTYEDELLEDYQTVLLNVTVVDNGAGDSGITELPKPVTDISLDKETVSLTAGESKTLKATITPSDATDQNLTWSVVSAGVVEIQGEGTSVTLVGKKAGTTTVTATAASGVSKSCEVTVTGVPVEGMELERELELTVGKTVTLKPVFTPENATNQRVTWSSSAPNIVSVKGGVVTARAEGKATITATSVEGGITKTCNVTVGPAVVESITLNHTSLELALNEKAVLEATVNPEGYVSQEVEWVIGDSSIVSFENGNVTALKGGETTITAKSKENPEITAVCTVKVPVPAESIILDKKEMSLTVGDMETLIATVKPDGSTEKNVTWASSNSSVVKVENGKITAMNVGTAVITATAGKVSAQCSVTVTPKQDNNNNPVEDVKITLDKTKLTLGVKEPFTLKVTVTPSSYSKSVTWTSSNDKIASVKNGKITAKKKGKATITATAGGKSVSCAVTVKPAPTKKAKISGVKNNISLKVKKSTTLKPKVSSKFGCNTFNYNSKNKKIAKVDKNGKVTGVKKGKTKITITTYNYNKKKKTGATKTINVTVK